MVVLELQRVWKKKAFFIMIIGAILLNFFNHWYGDLYYPKSIPLSAYKKLEFDLCSVGDNAGAYLKKEKELMDAMLFVEKSRMYLAQNSALGDAYVESVLNKDNNMEYYNNYLPVYLSGEYLSYTDNLELESKLINEVSKEYEQVSNYANYIKGIGEKKDSYSQMSIFANSDTVDSFSNKNIEKSVNDHQGMESIEPKYQTGRGIHGVFCFSVSDMLVILLTAYFALQLIWEEKETGLYNVTRATRNGRLYNVLSKLAALVVHTFAITLLFFMVNFLWYGVNAGVVDLLAPVQSVAEYMESSFRWNLLQMTLAVFGSKCLGALLIGLLTMLLAQMAKMIWIPCLGSGVFVAISATIYELIDVHGSWAFVKYVSCIALFHGDGLWGGYLNVSLFTEPVLAAAIAVVVNTLLLLLLSLVNVIVFLFFYEGNLTSKKAKSIIGIRVKLFEDKLLLKEMYKIFVMNKGIVIALAFLVAMGYMQFSTPYKVSAGEKYYQDFMLKLEGELDDSKEEFILAEQRKYEDANLQIENIEEMLAEGTISEMKATQMKNKYEMILSFYPQFEKVLYQYENAKTERTPFLYDTGYREFFWLNGNQNRILEDCFLAAVAILLLFGGTYSMEHEYGSWMLLGTTYTGEKTIKRTKFAICVGSILIGAVYSTVCRLAAINLHYPIRQIFYSLESIRGLELVSVPLVILIVGSALLHAMLYLGFALIILFISSKRKRTAEVYVFSTIVVLIPMIIWMVLVGS